MLKQAGKPNTIKQINQSLIRSIFMSRKELSCAEISSKTGISITTVRSIMNEMLEKGELVSLGLGDSSGGRRAERFIINDDCYYGISVCITDIAFYISLINIHSEISKSHIIPFDNNQDFNDMIISAVDYYYNDKIKAVGIGVPGVISENGFIINFDGRLNRSIDILDVLKQRFKLPVVFENDLRASALGFSKEVNSGSGVAFINFESSCNQISAGFVDGNNIIRGMGNYAGELGLMPYDKKKDFCEALYSSKSEKESTEVIAKLASWICCTLNPRQIMFCSDSGLSIDQYDIYKYLVSNLPAEMIPALSTSSDFEQYFIKGMAVLTSDLIFNTAVSGDL